MPLAPHILGAAAWFFLFIILPRVRHYSHSKPRLQPQSRRLDMLLRQPHQCRLVMRLSPTELRALARDLLISPDAPADYNWRFRPLHRLMLALWSLSNAQTTRKGRHVFGWAANSISNNLHDMVDTIIERLDAPDSRQ
jgi:hypothetical protein